MGPNKGVHAGGHFNTTNLEVLGKVFCKTIVDFMDNQEKVNRAWNELKIKYPLNGRPAINNYSKNDEDKDC